MSDTPPDPDKKGNGKAWAVLAATIGTTYGMNALSLHGVDFQLLGVPSELVKSTLEGALLWFLTWVTPDHLVESVADSILWARRAMRKLWLAATQPITDLMKP